MTAKLSLDKPHARGTSGSNRGRGSVAVLGHSEHTANLLKGSPG